MITTIEERAFAMSELSNALDTPLEENFKKALTELLVLKLLQEQDRYIGELTEELQRRSGGALTITFPYAAIYRLLERGCIEEVKKRFAPDGRRRQYYRITETGQTYLNALLNSYRRMTDGVAFILRDEEE